MTVRFQLVIDCRDPEPFCSGPLSRWRCASGLLLTWESETQGVGLRQFLGWVDLNLMAFLSRIVLRPLFRDPVPWIGWREMAHVTHRVRFIDGA